MRRATRYQLLKIKVTPAQARRFNEFAAELGVSVSQLVVTLLDAAERRTRGMAK